jgi:uncharacterized protein YjiS (DUF1127 family)
MRTTLTEVIRNWRLRSRSRRELAMFGQAARLDLGSRCDLDSEIRKPFWRP